MLTFFEKMLFEKFPGMPLPVRVFTYLFVLFLFAYLMLIPRFIDGQVVFKNPEGGMVPYRGAEILMHTEGRDYKFTTNEYGYVSIPVVSSLPESLEVRVHNVDLDKEFPVKFTALQIWKNGTQRLVMSNANVSIAAGEGNFDAAPGTSHWTGIFGSSQAHAGVLQLPKNITSQPTTQPEEMHIRNTVISAVSRVTGKQPNAIDNNSPLTGNGSPTYMQRIQIINELEKTFGFIIPDEHWKSMVNVGQLVDYIQKREILQKNTQKSRAKNIPRNWQDIQQSLPPEQRPVFKR